MSSLAVNAITDASGGNTASINSYTPTESNMAGRNRIINGDMRIDQRNAGASGTADGYNIDRWAYYSTQASKGTWQQNAGSVTPPTGFKNYLGFTSSSAYSIVSSDYFLFEHRIEGYNVADLMLGTASAATFTISFWVRSSLTGTFGGSVCNDGATRSYPFSFVVSSANTWEQKTVTIAGDTTGTWLTTNGAGLNIRFGLGVGSTFSGTAGSWVGSNAISATGATSVVGTSGATFYITGVQLEAGSVATPFERRQYGQELALCQRYYEKSFNVEVAPANGVFTPDRRQGISYGSTEMSHQAQFKIPKRANPSIVLFRGNAAPTDNQWGYYNGSSWVALSTGVVVLRQNEFRVDFNVTGRAAGQAWILDGNWTASAEL